MKVGGDISPDPKQQKADLIILYITSIIVPHSLVVYIADTLLRSAAEGQIVEGTSPSLKRGSLPQLVDHPSKESKAKGTYSLTNTLFLQ